MIKIVRRPWLPYTLPELSAWFTNFTMKFAALGVQLGFAQDDIDAVLLDNSTVQWTNNAMQANEANNATLKTFRDETLFGEKNDPPPTKPANDLPPAPVNLSASIIQRIVALKEKIELSDTYTPDIGAQLGIISPNPGGVSEESVKPSLKVFAAEGNYEFAAVVEGRAKSTMNELQYRALNQESWKPLKNFTGKSGNATYKPEPAGAPVKIELRVQLYRNNEKYGQPSDAVYLTLNP